MKGQSFGVTGQLLLVNSDVGVNDLVDLAVILLRLEFDGGIIGLFVGQVESVLSEELEKWLDDKSEKRDL